MMRKQPAKIQCSGDQLFGSQMPPPTHPIAMPSSAQCLPTRKPLLPSPLKSRLMCLPCLSEPSALESAPLTPPHNLLAIAPPACRWLSDCAVLGADLSCAASSAPVSIPLLRRKRIVLEAVSPPSSVGLRTFPHQTHPAQTVPRSQHGEQWPVLSLLPSAASRRH
jgi:hypothetical protein